jgi:hypothetical protein
MCCSEFVSSYPGGLRPVNYGCGLGCSAVPRAFADRFRQAAAPDSRPNSYPVFPEHASLFCLLLVSDVHLELPPGTRPRGPGGKLRGVVRSLCPQLGSTADRMLAYSSLLTAFVSFTVPSRLTCVTRYSPCVQVDASFLSISGVPSTT